MEPENPQHPQSSPPASQPYNQPQNQPQTTFQPNANFGSGPAAPAPAPAPSPTAPLPGTGPAPMGSPAANNYQQFMHSPADLHPKKSKKLPLIGAIAGALVVVLLGASAAAYYIIMNKPQNVLNVALMHTFSTDNIQSANFSGGLDVTPKGEQTMKSTFSGAISDEGAFELSGKADALVTNVTYDVRSVDGESVYLRVGGLNGLAELMSGGDASVGAYITPIVSAINNQWIEINSSMINQLTGIHTDIKDGKLSDADRKKLTDAYKQNQFLVVSKALKDEKVADTDSHHYQVIVDKTKLKSFVTAVKNAKIQNLPMDDASVKEFTKELDKVDFKKYPVDVWVSKGDKLIRQVAYSLTDNGDKLTFQFTIDDYNKAVHVTKPESSKTILEIMSSLLSAPGLEGLDFSSGATGSLQDLSNGISL